MSGGDGGAGRRGSDGGDAGSDGSSGADGGSAADGDATADSDSSADRREVAVPLRVYKAVTVVSTLLALAAVVGGFVLLDVATDRGRAPPSEVAVPVALAGLGAIAAGAAVYAYGTRFRAPDAGTGNVTDGTDESPPDG